MTRNKQWILGAAWILGAVLWAGGCGSGNGSDGPCPENVLEGDYTVSGDSNAVADLEGYTRITGNVNIGSTTDTDLAPLGCLKQVDGSLSFGFMEHLTSVQGLSNLESVGGNFGMYHCHVLTNLDGLEKLNSIGGYLDMSFNTVLPLCLVEQFVQRLRDNGFTGNAETSSNDETAICD